MKILLTAVFTLLLGLVAGFWLGWRLPKNDIQQLFEGELSFADTSMKTLQKLDSGDVAKTRRMLILSVYANLDRMQFWTSKGWASPSPVQRQQWTTVARETLDYMLQHKEELDPRDPYMQLGVKALGPVLSETGDMERLSELTNYLARVKQMTPANK
jgi:hypothetical protein